LIAQRWYERKLEDLNKRNDALTIAGSATVL